MITSKRQKSKHQLSVIVQKIIYWTAVAGAILSCLFAGANTHLTWYILSRPFLFITSEILNKLIIVMLFKIKAALSSQFIK